MESKLKVDGTWKAVGRLASYNKVLTIKDGVIEYSAFGTENRRDEFKLTECAGYKNITEEVMYISIAGKSRDDDVIIHAEEHNGHLISIVSFMTMEYDGRGLIVISEYVHEDDYQYVSENFTSNIYHFCNDREATPMMKMDTSVLLGANMMGMMGMFGAGKMPSMTGPNVSEPTETSGEGEWTCSCGYVNSGKFCGSCGMKKPSAN